MPRQSHMQRAAGRHADCKWTKESSSQEAELARQDEFAMHEQMQDKWNEMEQIEDKQKQACAAENKAAKDAYVAFQRKQSTKFATDRFEKQSCQTCGKLHPGRSSDWCKTWS